MRRPLYKKLSLTLGNRTGGGKKISFLIDASPVAQRWAKCLASHLQKESRVEKSYLFHGWLNESLSRKVFLSELNRHIASINNFFGHHPRWPYQIPESLSDSEFSRDALNDLHKHFEVLIGQFWNPSFYFLCAPAEVRYSILQINHLCHQLEALERSENAVKHGGADASICVSFPATGRVRLRAEDFHQFSTRSTWGDVYLHYAQLGKQHLDAFHDRDEVVARENISGLRFISGEFDVHLSAPDLADEGTLPQEFRKWLEEKGFDPADPTLALGRLVVARPEQLPENPAEFTRELFEFDDLREISLEGDEGSVSCAYPYQWRNPGYDSAQMAWLKPTARQKLSVWLRSKHIAISLKA